MSPFWLLVIGLVLLMMGYVLARWQRRYEWQRLAQLRDAVAAEMVTMHQVMRVNEAYFRAQDDLRRG